MSNILEGWGSQFFEDQNVLPKDLNMIEYSKNKLLRMYIQAKTRQPGVLISDADTDIDLKVTTTNGTIFSVNPGVAIDAEGRMLRVPNATVTSGSLGNDPAYHPAWPDRQSLATSITQAGVYYINLKYATQSGDIRYNDAGDSYETRIYDSYQIIVEVARAGITLAKVQLNASGSIVTDASETGFYNSDTGLYYALWDDRVLYKAIDGAVGDLESQVTQNTQDLGEEVRKSAGFLFPVAAQTLTDKWGRKINLLRMEVYAEGTSGNVIFQLYSGSTPSTLKGPLSVVSTTAGVWTASSTLNLIGYQGDTIQVYVASADSTITAATCSLVYKRR